MTRPFTRTQRGYTFVELMVVIVVLLLALLVAVTTYQSASNVAHQSQAHMRTHAENRRSLTVLAGILREAESASLTGFDASDSAEALTLERIHGADSVDRLRLPSERIAWESAVTESAVNLELGEVWLVSDTSRELLARRVPRGGFRIDREQDTLTVHLTTCSPVFDGEIVRVRGQTAVLVRN